MHVPFVDLLAQYRSHRQEFDSALRAVIERTAFIGGEFVRNFERDFAAANGVKHCIACGNGTDAIYIVLRMLGIGPGDEVITTAASWISTAETIGQTGARPVFVDVDDHYLIDLEQIERQINPRTKAIIPVHLYGQAAPAWDLSALCRKHGLKLIEDCAQAHFAKWHGRTVGTFGIASTFSFYPGKNLGAWGDAGAIVTDDDDVARRCRMYANHGALVKHQHEMEGINSRMDALHASLLCAKLKYVATWTAERRRVAARYNESLEGVGDLVLPRVRAGASHVYHLYVVRTERRDALKQFLAERGVDTAIHYPTALPFLNAYRHLNHTERDFPCAYRNQCQVLSLPMFAELDDSAVRFVCEAIKEFFLRAFPSAKATTR